MSEWFILRDVPPVNLQRHWLLRRVLDHVVGGSILFDGCSRIIARALGTGIFGFKPAVQFLKTQNGT